MPEHALPKLYSVSFYPVFLAAYQKSQQPINSGYIVDQTNLEFD